MYDFGPSSSLYFDRNDKMGPSSSKRRKLGHQSDDSDVANGENKSDESGTASQSSSDDESMPNTRTTSKHPFTRPNYVQNTNEGALYAGGMYKSSMFKLQVDEMLAEVKPNFEKQMGWVDDALHKLNTVIGAIEERDALPVSAVPKNRSWNTNFLRFRKLQNRCIKPAG